MLAIYSIAIFTTSLCGGLLPLISHFKDKGLKTFVTLGAGLLLGMSLLHMLPEAAELLPHTFAVWVLLGFLILLVLERFVMIHACEEDHCDYHTVGIAAFAGLTVHGIIEGFALASSSVSNIGFLVLIAILAHKAPTGFALTSILRLAGKTKKQMILFLIGVSLSGPLGVLLGAYILEKQPIPSTAGILLSISAGTFLYIAACDLLPELHKKDGHQMSRLISFLIGISISYISGLLAHP